MVETNCLHISNLVNCRARLGRLTRVLGAVAVIYWVGWGPTFFCPAFANCAQLRFHSRDDRHERDDGIHKAIVFAKNKHKGQVRKFDHQPYVTHPIRVARKVWRYTQDIELTIASYLHDTLEDTNTTYSEIKMIFGQRVADLVAELTSSDAAIARRGDKATYLVDKLNNMSLDALTIKLVDRLDNVSDFQIASAKFVLHYSRETRFVLAAVIAQRPDLRPLHQQLAHEIIRQIENGKAVNRL